MKEDSYVTCKSTAFEYLARGYSVIPVKPNKKPFIQWKEFQERHPTEDEIHKWWEKWPSARIAIVTGKVSGVCVIDIDDMEGLEAIQQHLPDGIMIPTAKTPKGGQHLYFKMPEQSLGNATRFIPGCDFKGEGGSCLTPPSKGYAWFNGLNLAEVELPPLPIQVFNLLNAYINTNGFIEKSRQKVDKVEKVQHFQQGRRDEDLFHVANCLLKANCVYSCLLETMRILAANCKPPFPPKEAENKIKSALERAQRKERNISNEIREWVLSTSGLFLSTDIYRGLLLSTREDQKLTWKVLNKMVEEGLVERVPERHGCYRTIDKECEEIDFLNAPEEKVDITLPFEINRKVEIMPGNIVVIAGEVNAGKTAFLLNVLRDNMDKFDVHYFSSEMGGSELKKRLKKFDYPLSLNEWKFKFKERSDNFGDVIVSGKGKLNIIDYLELHDNFFLIAKHLSDIHKKLQDGIAIVAIQKNPGTDTGLGGFRGMEKPRLYLSMSKGRLRITKAKNWATQNNPNGLEVNFKIIEGCRLIKQGDWHLADYGGNK